MVFLRNIGKLFSQEFPHALMRTTMNEYALRTDATLCIFAPLREVILEGGRTLLAYLSQGLVLGGAAAAQPGPFQAYLLAQTLKNGWRSTMWAAFAPLLSDGPIVAVVLLVLTQTPAQLLTLLRLGGGIFLLYLAWGAYRGMADTKTADATHPPAPETTRRSIAKAALMNALSPNPWIFWATIAGPILIEGWRQGPGVGVSFVVGFYGTLIGGFLGFVALFATVGRLDKRLSRVLSAISALALAGFGLYQLWLGLSAI